ncbi:hypothetical protein ACF0H5_011623 [Mactra antiquata]
MISSLQCLVVMLSLMLTCFIHAQRPNIILIVADDLGWDDVGFHGSEVKTPNIDKLAYDGVILNNYYVSPICTPTRGSLMTGRHPIHLGLQHGVIRAPEPYGLPLNHTTMAQHLKHLGYATHIVGKHYVISAPEPWGLPLNHTTMAQHFKHLGYSTHIVGKWHLGFFREEYLPTNRGFDSHYGYWTGKEDYFNHLDQDVYMGLDYRRNLAVVNHTAYSTEEYTNEAVKIINSHNKSEPLFLYLAHQAVHAGNSQAPLQSPDEYVNRFPYIDNSRRRTFAGMAAALDDSVGEVVRTLNHNNMMDNTIIVFSTDNGGPANNYDKNSACNYPLRGTKNTLWEGGVHGVGFVHSRLLKKKHVKTDSMVHVSDWLPTLYSAAGGDGADLGLIDGIDQWEMILNNGSSVRTEILHNIDPVNKFSAIRVGDYKLIQGDISGGRNDHWYPCSFPFEPEEYNATDSVYEKIVQSLYEKEISIRAKMSSTFSNHSPNSPFNIMCGDPPANYTTNCLPQKAACLFHIPTDPCEYNNIADKNPEIVANLQARIQRHAEGAVPPVNKPIDKSANPLFHGGVWVPWQGSGL